MKQLTYHWDVQQGTEQWHDLRKLKMTASNATAIGANGKGLQTYISKLVKESIIASEHYTNADIERGNTLEPLARLVYEMERGVTVKQCGFIQLNNFVGFSPDGLTEDNEGEGLVEIKARNDQNHFDLLAGGGLESDVRNQIQMQLWISDRQWCDFVSYNPNFNQSLFVQRVYPDDKYHDKLVKGLMAGEDMIKEMTDSDWYKKEINN